MKKIVIPYFPKGMKYATPLFFMVAIWLLVINFYVIAGILTVFAVAVLTTNYVTEISLPARKCEDYISIAGLKLGVETTSFQQLQKIVITKGNHAQRVSSQLQTRTLQWTDYTGTLVFDDNKTLDLLTHVDKTALVASLRDFSAFLNVPLEDHTILR